MSSANRLDSADPAEFDPFGGPAVLRAVPTTGPQREIWTAAQIGDEASLAFNEAVALRVTGTLDASALHGAIAAVLDRHEALRSTISADGLTLVVTAASTPALPVHDWAGLPQTEREARVAALLDEVVRTPFDLVGGPLVRFALARLAGDDHLLVITAHHIVCDGWSFGVIAGDLAALYTAMVEGRPATLPPVDPFTDHALEQQTPSQAAAAADAERFWQAHLAGAIPVLELPTDRARPRQRSYRADREDRVLGHALMQRVRQAAGQERASVFGVLLAGYAALVQRLTAQEELIVGIPAAGQAAAGKTQLVGHCVNMLPLKLRPASQESFRALLREVRKTTLDAFDHQALSLGSLLERLPIARDASRGALVSIIFNLDRALTAETLRFAGLVAELRSVPRRFENFELFLNAVEQADGSLVLECQYNADLFERETVARWLACYETLLDSAVASPETGVGRLALLPAAELARVRTCGYTAQTLPTDARVHRLVEAQAARTPDAPAVSFKGRVVTYGELDARANQLARALRTRGVRRGGLVGLCVERSPEMLVGLLGILKAGGGYVPLDPGYPADRLAFMVEDSGMTALVTESRVLAGLGLPLAPERVLALDAAAAEVAAQSTSALPDDDGAATPESVAYVIYTSGSTGKPKGVLVPHRAVVNLLTSVQRTPGVRATDAVLAVTTLSFDIAVSEVILPLTVGARIVLATRETAADGPALLQLIEREQVTWIDATPATYRLLIGAGWTRGRPLTVICTGEALPRELAEALCARADAVWNGYGPTETTVWSTFWRVTAPVERVLIGRPIANTHVRVLDALQQPVPLGVAGELYIGGAGVTLGYHGRPELTAQRFLADPFADEAGARMYRTGDVVRLLPDGNLDYLGRNDDQVKVRGYRIELGEIESVLARHPSVQAAAVAAREDRPGDVRLVGYVVPAPGTAPSDTDLRAFVRGTLPDYMVPALYMVLPSLPLTPSGKVDRKRLPAPDASAPVSDAEFVAPRSETERLLATLWQDALAVPRVSVRDDFFALGGHSLLASQVLARLRRDHGVALSFRTMFEAPTIESFAALVDAQARPGAPAPSDAIAKRRDDGPAPLSSGQERIWLLEQLDPGQSVSHTLGAAWHLRGALDDAALQASLDDFVARHEPMRASFQLVDGEPRQVIARDAHVLLQRVDLSSLDARAQDADVERLMVEVQLMPFELDEAPLLRVWLVRLASDHHLLLTTRHNIVWDGWSFDIFLRDLGELYAARVEGRSPRLPALPVSYTDFSAWQSEWLRGPEMARQIAWWREHLAGDLPVLALPTDRPRSALQTYAGGKVELSLPRAEEDALTELARQHGATLFMVLLAAYQVLLHRLSGQRDLVVGTPVRARTRPELEELVGPFVNTVLLRSELGPQTPFAALLERVRDLTLDAFSHQEMPLELLGGRPPVLRALFSMQDARGRTKQMGPVTIAQRQMPHVRALNDLMLWTMERADGLFVVLNYSAELFDEATAQDFLHHYRALLRSILVDASQPVARLARLDEEQRAALVAPRDPRPADTVHAAFDRQAAAVPSSPAVVAGGRVTEYGELGAMAAAVAGALRQRGVAPGAPVAVLLRAGVERTAAMLGVLRAGAALLLVDPALPPAFVAALLEGAHPAAVLIDDRGRDALASRGDASPVLLVAEALATPVSTSNAVAPQAPAVVRYSLDGNGRPTFTTVRHDALAATLADARAALAVDDHTVLAGGVTGQVDAALAEVLLPLGAGGRVAFVEENALLYPEDLRAALGGVGATHVVGSAAVWDELCAEGWTDSKVTVVVSDGASASDRTMAALDGRAGRVFTAYALPETGWLALDERQARDGRRFMGASLGTARGFVLDEQLEPVATGMTGELFVGGAAIEGGVQSPALHAAGRLVRTGDRAILRGGGRIEVEGRTDDRLRLGDLCVSPAAIEGVLRSHQGIAGAAVARRVTPAGDARLVAYVVAGDGATYTDTELRLAAREALPSALVPQLFVELDALPLADGGRIDRARLPLPAGFAPTRAVPEAPRTAAEHLIARLWREALAVGSVGVHDNFFDIGGYSLLCFQVIEKLRGETGVRLNPRVFLLDTLEQVAAQFEREASRDGGTATGAPATTGTNDGVFQRLRRLAGRSA